MLDNSIRHHWSLAEHQRLERRAIADRIAAHPSLVHIGIAKIDQLLARGHAARTLLMRARALLAGAAESSQGLARLLDVLRSDREDMQDLADSLPLRSVLSERELRALAADVIFACA